MECLNCKMGEMKKPEDDHPSYLVCDNCGALELVYLPQDYQQPLHSVPYLYNPNGRKKVQIIGAFGGYGSGKSRDTLSECLIRALENPNGTGLFTAPTLPQLKKTTLKTWFDEVCPPPLIEDYNKSEMSIRMVNGFTFYCIPSDDETKLRSINAGVIHMEEASGIKRSIFDQFLARNRDPFVDNRCIIVCSNPDLGWIKEVLVDNDARKDPAHPEHHDYNPQITAFVWPTKLNKYLPEDFIQINSVGKPPWWIRRYLEGSFEHAEGMVYPNASDCFIDSTEYTKPYRDNDQKVKVDQYGLPAHWERFITLDHGIRNPTAVLFHAINPVDGEVVTYNEYYAPNRTVPEHAKVLRPLIDEIPAGRLRFMVADPSTGNKTDPINGKSVQALYQEYGMYFTPGNNNVDAGILRVNSYIERGKWRIFKDKCLNLCKELLNYKYKEETMDNVDKNLDEKPVKANDHACDSIRYGFMRLPDDPNLLKSMSYTTPNRYTKSDGMLYDDFDEDDDYTPKGDWLSYA